jgi:plastocyanin
MTTNNIYTRWSVAAAIVAIGVAAFGCQQKSATAGAGARTPAAVVVVSDTPAEFVPNVLTVRVGDTVEWSNTGGIAHSVEFLNGNARGTSFIIINPDESASYRFTAPGTYSYACRFHVIDGMEGKIVVVGDSDVTKVSADSH